VLARTAASSAWVSWDSSSASAAWWPTIAAMTVAFRSSDAGGALTAGDRDAVSSDMRVSSEIQTADA